jgi:hypothetical protein
MNIIKHLVLFIGVFSVKLRSFLLINNSKIARESKKNVGQKKVCR